MTVYITKYALTRGIIKIDGVLDSASNSIRVDWTRYHKPDWHMNRSVAVDQAERMRLAKIKSLEKQLAKMKALRFSEA